MRDELLDTEAVELPAGERSQAEPTARPLPASAEPRGEVSIWRGDVRAAALAAAGGLVAGAVTVLAMRATRRSHGRRPTRRARGRERPVKIVASRSFMVDVHVLDR